MEERRCETAGGPGRLLDGRAAGRGDRVRARVRGGLDRDRPSPRAEPGQPQPQRGRLPGRRAARGGQGEAFDHGRPGPDDLRLQLPAQLQRAVALHGDPGRRLGGTGQHHQLLRRADRVQRRRRWPTSGSRSTSPGPTWRGGAGGSQTLLTPPAGLRPDDGHVAGAGCSTATRSPLAGQTVTLTGPTTANQPPPATAAPSSPTSTLAPTRSALTPPATSTARAASRPPRPCRDRPPDQQASSSTTTGRPPCRSTWPRPRGRSSQAGIAITVANSNLTVGTKSFPEASTGGGATRTVTPLFPFASGYQVWAGECADADPAPIPAAAGGRPGHQPGRHHPGERPPGRGRRGGHSASGPVPAGRPSQPPTPVAPAARRA